MKVSLFLASIISLLIPALSFASPKLPADLNTVSFKGHTSCIVYLAEATENNFGVVCDGDDFVVLNAPSRNALGEVSFTGFKKAYSDFMNVKCSEAGLNVQTVIDNETFWGVLCHN